jgi:hypothetical protein
MRDSAMPDDRPLLPPQATVRARLLKHPLVRKARLFLDVLTDDITRRAFQLALRRRLARRMDAPTEQFKVGPIGRHQPGLPAALLGLRLETATLEVHGSQASYDFEHRWLPQHELRWDTQGKTGTRPGGQRFDLAGRLKVGTPIVGERMSQTFAGTHGRHGYYWPVRAGGCDRIIIGSPEPSYEWKLWLLGLGRGCRTLHFDGVDFDLRTVDAKLTEPDLPRLVVATLRFPSAVDSLGAERWLTDALIWLLQLYAGQPVVPAGIWNPSENGGHLTDFRRPLFAPPRGIIPTTVSLDAYLSSAIAGWQALGPEDHRAVRVGIGAREATTGAPVDAAIPVCALTLEMMADTWLTEAERDFGLPSRAARRRITADVRSAVHGHAPGSELEQRLEVLITYMYQRPAIGRFERLLNKLNVPYDPADLRNFVDQRNAVVHAAAGQGDRQLKIRAMLCGHHWIGACVLSVLGYHGEVYDESAREILRDEPDSP